MRTRLPSGRAGTVRRWLRSLRFRLYRSRLYRATLYNLPLGRYRCSMCNRLITDRTCDRNLIADWAHCDRCLDDLLRAYVILESEEGRLFILKRKITRDDV